MGAVKRPQLNQAGDRLLLAAQMYHAGKVRSLICTGQSIRELNPDGVDPAEQSRRIFERLAIPRDAIRLSGGRNTAEEFRRLAEVLPPDQRVCVLTSAWHMPRALRLAKANGLSPVAAPADFRGTHRDDEGRPAGPGALLLSLIPQRGGAVVECARLERRTGTSDRALIRGAGPPQDQRPDFDSALTSSDSSNCNSFPGAPAFRAALRSSRAAGIDPIRNRAAQRTRNARVHDGSRCNAAVASCSAADNSPQRNRAAARSVYASASASPPAITDSICSTAGTATSVGCQQGGQQLPR